jgi:tetratricopeptide (TPR) repeat protein
MSVLYKALARASKARENLRNDPLPPPNLPPVGRRPRRRGQSGRRFLMVWAASLALCAGGFLLFGDRILSLIDQMAAVEPAKVPMPTPVPAGPARVNPAASVPTPPKGESDGARVNSGTGVPAGGGGNPETPAGTPEPPRSSAPSLSSPPPEAEPVAQSAPSAPNAAEAATAPLPPVAPPVASNVPGGAAVRADSDLPPVLDRIRRQKGPAEGRALVSVARQGGQGDILDRDGEPAISVTAAAPVDHVDANSAYDLLLHHRYEAALSLYEKILRSAPKNLPALLGKATAEQKLGRLIDARASYLRVLSLDPDNREALTNMTTILADRAPDQALEDLRSLQQSHPSFSPLSAEIASIEARQGNVPSAIQALNTAIAQSPDNALYRLNLAILQDRAGMSEDAAASYRAALDLLSASTDPPPMPLEQIRQRLRYLQGR